MFSLCCKAIVWMEERGETAHWICSLCGKPCDRVGKGIPSEKLTDESIRASVEISIAA
jgi:hypothetical protein